MTRRNDTDANVLSWIGYWDRASMGPNLHKVNSVEDMTLCRMFNPCLQTFTTADRSDGEMFDLLQRHRSAA